MFYYYLLLKCIYFSNCYKFYIYYVVRIIVHLANVCPRLMTKIKKKHFYLSEMHVENISSYRCYETHDKDIDTALHVLTIGLRYTTIFYVT